MNESALPTPETRLLPATWKLLALQARISINQFRHAKAAQKFGQVMLTLAILAFAVFLFWLSQQILGVLRSPYMPLAEADSLGLLFQSLPALLLGGVFVGILLTSFGVLLQAMYLSGDMDFLLASPIPIRAVFLSKLLQAILPNFTIFAFFGLPLLFGLGASNGYHFLYYPLVVITLAALALAAAGLASLLVMLVVRVLPPRRAAEILGFFGAIVGMLFSQIGNITNAFRSEEIALPGSQLGDLVIRANAPWMPLNWPGQGLVAIGEGRWLPGALLVGLTLLLTFGAFWFALRTAERWYYTGWARMQAIANKKKTARPQGVERQNILEQTLPPPVWAILSKDFMVMRRDLRNLSQLVSPVILGILYTVLFFRPGREIPAGRGEAPDWFMASLEQVAVFSSIGMALFVGWMLLSRLAGMAFSLEGRNYWVLKAAPLRVEHLLTAKFLAAFLPTWALSLLFLLGIGILQRPNVFVLLYGLVAVTLCLAGTTGMLLAFGAAGANLTWTDPRRMNAGGMGCLGQFLAFIYMPICFGLYVAPPGILAVLGQPIALGYLLGFLLGSTVSITGILLPPWLARGVIARLGNE